MTTVNSHGKVITAIGGTFNSTDPTVEAQPQVWVSDDGGATWSGQALPTISNAVTVTYAGSGFVNGRFFVIGTLTKGDERQATMWTSSDGSSWKAQPLTDPLLRGPGRRTPMATVVQGDTVIGIAQIVTLGYAGPVLFTQG